MEAGGKVSLPSRKLEPQLLQGAETEGGKYPGSFLNPAPHPIKGSDWLKSQRRAAGRDQASAKP